jgi:hypothetical protein
MCLLAVNLFVSILFSCENARDGSCKKWKFELVSPNYSDIHFNNRIQESESLNVLQNISSESGFLGFRGLQLMSLIRDLGLFVEGYFIYFFSPMRYASSFSRQVFM